MSDPGDVMRNKMDMVSVLKAVLIGEKEAEEVHE